EEYTSLFETRNWYEEIIPDDALDVSNPENDAYNEAYAAIRDKLRFDRVVINAGHGEWDPGSIGYKGVTENDITLAVSLNLGEYITAGMPDVEVIYTREDDTYTGLAEPGHIANVSE